MRDYPILHLCTNKSKTCIALLHLTVTFGSSTIKTRYKWNVVENGVKHLNHNPKQ